MLTFDRALFLAQVPHEDRRPDRADDEQHARRPRRQAGLRPRERPLQAGQVRRGQRHRLHPLVHRKKNIIRSSSVEDHNHRP